MNSFICRKQMAISRLPLKSKTIMPLLDCTEILLADFNGGLGSNQSQVNVFLRRTETHRALWQKLFGVFSVNGKDSPFSSVGLLDGAR
jgi:hypothetical protein